jgi:hypothetical protein
MHVNVSDLRLTELNKEAAKANLPWNLELNNDDSSSDLKNRLENFRVNQSVLINQS